MFIWIKFIPAYIKKGINDIELKSGLENLSKSAGHYAVIGNMGIYLHLNDLSESNLIETIANEPIKGARHIQKEELNSLAKHYDAIIETAEDIKINDFSIKAASIPYLVSDNCTRSLGRVLLVELAKKGNIDRELAEEIRSIFKATDLYENWPDFLQLLYDFAPNFI